MNSVAAISVSQPAGVAPAAARATHEPGYVASDVIDIQGGPGPAEQPQAAPEPVDPLVASFEALQLWARSCAASTLTDTSFQFRETQEALFAYGTLPGQHA